MTDETTTEQLVEIEGQAAEYTPPDGWRVLPLPPPAPGMQALRRWPMIRQSLFSFWTVIVPWTRVGPMPP